LQEKIATRPAQNFAITEPGHGCSRRFMLEQMQASSVLLAFRLLLFTSTDFARVILVPVLPKRERLRIFLERLKSALPVNSADEALTLLSSILNAVEDEFSGVPSNPSLWKTDGRMYPPQEDCRRNVPNRPSLRRYRSVSHNTFIGLNGSIRIEALDRKALLDKAGGDGRRAYALDA
jgi:hypothetical protein